MNKHQIFLFAYFDEAAAAERQSTGFFDEHNCGGPSTWVLGPKPSTNRDLLWLVPYFGSAYAFVFYPYDMNNTKTFFKTICDNGDYFVARREAAIIVQTDVLFPEWDEDSHLLANMDPEELGGTLSLIKFNKTQWV